MSILEKDPLNHNKLTLLTPSKALDAAVQYHTMGFTGEREEQLKVEKLQEVLGALLNTLNKTPMLDDRKVVDILNCPYIVHALEQGETP